MQPPASSAEGVKDLPWARGRVFAGLDDYLAYRATLGAQDIPWYKLVGPDRYELMTRRAPDEAPRYFTRAELLAQFGFKD